MLIQLTYFWKIQGSGFALVLLYIIVDLEEKQPS